MNGLQEKTSELLKEKKKPITVVLKSGVMITGQILAMDKFTILMMVRGKQQLVYKQAVSTITT
ncbi:RNA chaperone Hfq [Bacillus pseudomycoides]|uniref:RNA chaperone Hfq n=1 Tax=Bacillus pseudomycoides TaxID=64104 RepID=UPI000BF160AA|nr:RNA chaperone Hfq [Bacillus pseudomycoides]PEI45434.1 RNA chaperone Hfq [Bacillus pseudomycoides]PGA65281.1 RNA chaperone Hfq [Bacillus pseudomycoides]PHD96452.1 RNA chaperone Hfq [Bacillus pseudomycoides]PHE84241.1 RNA chaperone Hfq [Bacillus pseudomycoides]